jgi:predicted transcriptional regulator
MTLKEYLRKNKINPYEFALQINIPRVTMWRWLNGYKPSWENAKKLEELTKGHVKIADMRPSKDDAKKWW